MSDLHPLEVQVLAHRYLYYVLARPVLSDYAYDLLEREAVAALPETSVVNQPGSDLASSYPPVAVRLAERLLDR